MNGDCNVIDICNPTPKPTKRPTPKPTPNPVTPSPTPCEDMVFFVDGNTCTNDIYIADAMSYSSAVACCNMNFGVGSMNYGCNVVDICNPTPAPTPCGDQMFFFDGNVCSNEIYIADTAAYGKQFYQLFYYLVSIEYLLTKPPFLCHFSHCCSML